VKEKVHFSLPSTGGQEIMGEKQGGRKGQPENHGRNLRRGRQPISAEHGEQKKVERGRGRRRSGQKRKLGNSSRAGKLTKFGRERSQKTQMTEKKKKKF